MTRERALEKAIHLSKTTHSICVDSESFWENVIVALSAEPCEDAISREELIEALNTWDKFGYAPTNELIPLRGNVDKDKYVPYIHYDDVLTCIRNMPSVSPQQKVGRWVVTDDDLVYCSECEDSYYPRPIDASWYYCPHCGAKMEVKG